MRIFLGPHKTISPSLQLCWASRCFVPVRTFAYKRTTFNDKTRVRACGGNGGTGTSSIDREKAGVKGAPTGANGGKGGDIFFQAVKDMPCFQLDRYVYRAGNGRRGGSAGCTGRNGEDIVVKVPVGTVVHLVKGKDENGMLQTIPWADLNTTDEKVLIARGGECGRGNAAFKCSYRKGPTYSEIGEYGQELELLLELKLIADVGLVGFPNAGKSSLLCALSRATPLIASYPFTTLKPSVGTVEGDDHADIPSFSIADIPGLIEGAHENKGLGHAFLRHVERTKVLLYVLDAAGSEGRDPVEDFRVLQQELRLYQSGLLDRPALIFANKQDLRTHMRDYRKNVRALKEVTELPVICGSAKAGTNLEELVIQLRQTVTAQNERIRELVEAQQEERRLFEAAQMIM